MKQKFCTCHGKYKIWLSATGECKITAQRKAYEQKKVKSSLEQPVRNTPRQKPIAKVSKNQAKRLSDYSKGKKKHFDEVREKKGYVPCMVGVEGICLGEATTWHHPAGRLGSKLLEFEEMIDACLPCHQFVEENAEWAKENGFSKSRLNK